MEPTVVSVLDSIKSLALTFSIWGFVGVNLTALAVVATTRSRALVQRWTSPWLAANLLLLGTGAGVPLLAGVCKSVVQVVASSVTSPPAASPVD